MMAGARRGLAGFTLIEMVTTVAIVGILAGAAVPMAELAVNLEVHEAIQRNGRPGRTFDQHAVVADVTCHDRRELGVAASIFPNDLTGDRELAALRRPFVAARLVALNEAKTLFHRDPPG